MKIVSLVCASLLCASAQGVTYTYTNTETGENLIELGYPVPTPIDSLTPVDGFRTYASLDLRHQQMAEQSDLITQVQVGQTFNGLPIWAYLLSDDDNQTHSGAVEASALINGTIHAREWQSPEAVTGYIEYLFDEQNNQYLASYLLDNLTLVIIPVMNVDGFLQTQRFPLSVTADPVSPRDGRMRRKNMRNVDADLDTLADNLNGIDLNRNNAPYWATNSQRSSDDVSSIVHHGSGPASEPETQALQQAAILAGADRLRFYTDTHSFSQIYFTPMTNNARRNNITGNLATVMRAANNFRYDYGPSASGAGIGSTDEYFANTYQIPSYTLEIEPKFDNPSANVVGGGRQYGGFGVSHDGFILPASEVARMRDETARAAVAGLYAVAEVPALMGFEVWDEAGENRILAQQWQGQGGQRQLVVTQAGQLQAQTNYALRLMFNKPMRWLENGEVSPFANLSPSNGVSLRFVGRAGNQDVNWDLPTNDGAWLVNEGFQRYKTDTYAVDFSLGADFDWSALTLLALEIEAEDFAGQRLDTNPASIVDWQNGAWTNYENSVGNANTDTGGRDVSMRLIDDDSDLFAPTTPPTPAPTPSPTPSSVDSGGGAEMWLLLFLGLSLFRRDK